MKFRTPELFLGAFLAVAIFACGMLFASPLSFQINNPTPTQGTQHQAANKLSENGDKAQSLWVPTDSVGPYTLVLAVVTALLVGVSGLQVFFCCAPTGRRGLPLRPPEIPLILDERNMLLTAVHDLSSAASLLMSQGRGVGSAQFHVSKFSM
jgi:hypothetical protein